MQWKPGCIQRAIANRPPGPCGLGHGASGVDAEGRHLALLWQEYKAQQPDGYQQPLCDLYGAWRATLDRCLRKEHRAGEKLFVDYAGQTVPVPTADRDHSTGQILSRCGELTHSRRRLDTNAARLDRLAVRAFGFFGGVRSSSCPTLRAASQAVAMSGVTLPSARHSASR